MKINLNNWEHKNLNSKKLPTEEDLEDFFSCVLTDPVPSGKGFFESIRSFEYNSETGYRAQNYPVINKEDAWIAPSLSDLNPEVDLSLSGYALVGGEGYNEDTESGLTIPPLGMTLDEKVRSDLLHGTDKTCLSKQWTIKNFTDLSSIMYSINSFIKNFTSHECETFKYGLEKRGYIQTSTHSDILNKIEAIRKVNPVEPIYIIAEQPLLDYLKVHSEFPGELKKNCWLVMDNYSSYSYRQDINKFHNYKSAVFTTESMLAKHSFELHHKFSRGNRCWTVYLAIIGRLGIDIPEDPLANKNSELVLTDNHPRWDRLF